MVRNSVTLYEDDAWDVAFALQDYVEMSKEMHPDVSLGSEYEEKLLRLAEYITERIR